MNRQDKAAAGMLAGVKAGHLQAKLDKRLRNDSALPCWLPWPRPLF